MHDIYKKKMNKKRIMNKKKRIKKGSLTVEASLVIPICVLVLAIILSLTFYVYLRCWYTQTACEASVQGSSYGVLRDRDGVKCAEEKWRSRKKESGFSGKQITGALTGNKNEVRIKVSGQMVVWGRQNLQFETAIRQKIIRPVPFVRKIAAYRT